MNSSLSICVEALAKAGGDLYEVGGPVRDALLGRDVKDHDLLCRKLTAREISKTLSRLGKVSAVGKSFGIVKFSARGSENEIIDIALPRKEISTGAGHRDFEVNFDPDLPVEIDLARRDFTINAMAKSLSDGKIIDPFNGRDDLEKRLIRMVFPRAFEEDPLRLIRAVQFAARFGFKIEHETLEAMKKSSSLIETVSGERISMELVKLMSAERPSYGFDLMNECGILKHMLPELYALKGIKQDKQPGDDVYKHTMRVLDAARSDSHIENTGSLELLFAALLHDIGKAKTASFNQEANRVVFFGHQIVSARMAKRWMNRMKLASSGVDESAVLRLIEHHMFETKAYFTDRAIRRFISKIGPDLIFRLLDMRLSDNRGGKHPNGIKGVLRLRKRIREEMEKKPPFGTQDLAINGHDIMSMGIPEGKMVGTILSALVEIVLDNPEENTRDKLLALTKEMVENPEKLNGGDGRDERKKTES